ncbi:Inhibitory POU protein [Polyplax serrata]|uniref:Inhibitory POU protein n=1 Tax=Polyplax serrata TaxID=468196 RepID=A0ABR1AT56_POLSC
MRKIEGDIFGGLNDGLLSRAEALAAVDIGKHPVSTTPGLPQLKHDMMYHHGMGTHPGTPNSRSHQTCYKWTKDVTDER